jgi:hypothetical protein
MRLQNRLRTQRASECVGFSRSKGCSACCQEWRNSSGKVITFDHLTGEIGFVAAPESDSEAPFVGIPLDPASSVGFLIH